MKYSYLKDACEQIDAGIFSGDVLEFPENREGLHTYLDRWVKALHDYEQGAASASPEPEVYKPDSAGVFAAALSLWSIVAKDVKPYSEFAEAVGGCDNLMRITIDIATAWEAWACDHINFDETEDVWPYMIQDKFGSAFEKTRSLLDVFTTYKNSQDLNTTFHRIAARLELPMKWRKT
jgi:hypothetical protein